MEADLLGKSRIRGPRRALVRVAEPVDLRDEMAGYRESRRETLARLTGRLEETVGDLLWELRGRTKLLEEPGEKCR
jgi:hypothetical protein